MKELYPLFGVVAIVNTPFDERDRLDIGSIERGIEDRIAAGVSGLLAPAVASEVNLLSFEERKTIVRVMAERTAGRIPLVAGTSAATLSESVAMGEFATDLGCTGVMVQAPANLAADADALRRYFEEIARTEVPMLMIQDLDWNGTGLPLDTITMLFEEIPAFRCLKVEVAPAGPKYTAILNATQGRLNVSGGWSCTQMIEALDRGVHAFMLTGHYWTFVEIVRRYQAGDREGARELFWNLLPLISFGNQHIDISNRFLKIVAVRQGIFRNDCLRDPTVPFDEYHQRIAEDLLETAMTLDREAGRFDDGNRGTALPR